MSGRNKHLRLAALAAMGLISLGIGSSSIRHNFEGQPATEKNDALKRAEDKRKRKNKN